MEFFHLKKICAFKPGTIYIDVYKGDFINLDFPSTPSTAAERLPLLVEAFGAEPAIVERSRFDILAGFESAKTVRWLQPDFRKLSQIPVRGIIVTALSDDPRFDFISRFFAPTVGVDEDPVCGSAHCCLTPYWAQRLGKTELMAYQASLRGGVLRLKLSGDRAAFSEVRP